LFEFYVSVMYIMVFRWPLWDENCDRTTFARSVQNVWFTLFVHFCVIVSSLWIC